MAELTFKSPGISTREIDLSGPTTISPQGTPAGIIGTSLKGHAFVPITVATYQDFVAEFGGTDGEKFGPLAMREWMRSARAGTYVRVLGVGDGKKRSTSGDNTGRVNNAGFTVGQRLVQANGNVSDNTYAGSTNANGGALGRSYFLGCYLSDSNGSTVLKGAGITGKSILGASGSHPMVRGVLFAPSGVLLALSSTAVGVGTNDPVTNLAAYSTFGASANAGSAIGSVNLSNSNQNFVMLLNGHSATDEYPSIYSASFDPDAAQYFHKVFNTDPAKIEKAGHYLYAHWNSYQSHTTLTGSGITAGIAPTGSLHEAAFLLSGTQGRNAGTTSVPNFEGFEERYQAAFSPWIVSQKFGGQRKNLFKFHALDDGARGNDLYKITVENVAGSSNENNKYGTFDILVRDFRDSDAEPRVFESFRALSLDPTSDRYIARIIGNMNMYYDFDQKAGAQKLRIEGTHPNKSSYVRVQVSDDVDDVNIDAASLPVGFRGHHHLVTSGSGILEGYHVAAHHTTQDKLNRAVQMPVPFRDHLRLGVQPRARINAGFTWGVQFEVKDSLDEPNKNQKLDEGIRSYTKYFPMMHTEWQNAMVGDNAGAADSSGVILDSDRFNNGLFTLENIQVVTNSSDLPDPLRWGASSYRRDAIASGSLQDTDGSVYTNTRFFDPDKDFTHLPTRKYLKFSLFMQGGFDGFNMFDKEKTKMSDTAVRREMTDTSGQGGKEGPSIASYRKAIDVMEEKSDVDIQLLAIPGQRHEAVTDYAIDSVESRFDALLIMDVEEKDNVNAFITGSSQIPNVSNTVTRFEARNLDSSFAAAYYPDVVMVDPATNTNVVCPPSVAVLGAFSRNDAVAHPWFAPAGFSRGALNVIESQVKLNRSNLDALYEADINPLTSFPHSQGVIVFGQKTLLAAQSSLDRVNVRRLLIDVRRKVRKVANTILFEPNRASTLARFSAAVTPILTRIQQQQGLDRFKVQIDTSTTTQSDVENNTVRGKIFLQPTRSVEFIALDFVVTNQGADV